MLPGSRQSPTQPRIPGLTELSAMINAIPKPALIYDRVRDNVMLVNSELLKLTAFASHEVCGGPIQNVLKGLNIDIKPGPEIRSGVLLRRKRTTLTVNFEVGALDLAGQWYLVTIQPTDFGYKVNDQDKLFAAMLQLSKLYEENQLDGAVQKAIQITQDLLGATFICIYQVESGNPRLIRVQGIQPESFSIFPEFVELTDLVKLSETIIWTPGKRMVADLQRLARVAGLSYLATTPLGQEGARFGLLVAGELERLPGETFGSLMDILGAHFSSALEHFMLTTNLRQENKVQQRLLSIWTTLMESSREGILVLDTGLLINEMNPSAEWVLGYSNKEVFRHPVGTVVIGAEGLLIPALEDALKGVPTHNIGNVSLHRRNGQSFPAEVQTIPVMRDGQVLAVLLIVSDVSEHEQIRTRTQQLEQRAVLGEFTAIFAHEVRNPINNISTGLQLMTSRLPQDDPNLDLITRMEGDCVRLNHLMESVLAFSRPMEPRFEPMDMTEFLQRILDRWRPRLARVNVTTFFKAEENLPKVKGDPRSLEQVFTNLISNSIEAMSKTGGILGVGVSLNIENPAVPMIEVTISDNGPGIPDDVKSRMFEPFVTTNPRGTGLGLAITKRIMTAHRGNIQVTSFPGGTVFHVYLLVTNGE